MDRSMIDRERERGDRETLRQGDREVERERGRERETKKERERDLEPQPPIRQWVRSAIHASPQPTSPARRMAMQIA